MSTLGVSEVVRCSECEAIAIRPRMASLNLSMVNPPSFYAILRGSFECPCCHAHLKADTLKKLCRLDQTWKKHLWYGYPELIPLITQADKRQANNPPAASMTFFF